MNRKNPVKAHSHKAGQILSTRIQHLRRVLSVPGHFHSHPIFYISSHRLLRAARSSSAPSSTDMVKDPVVPSLITETQQPDDDYSPYSPSTNVQPPVGLFGNDKIEWQTSSKPPLSRRLSIRPRSLPSAPKMPTKTLALFPIVARATIIKVYRDRSGRKILPESLLAHSKILRELNSLMG